MQSACCRSKHSTFPQKEALKDRPTPQVSMYDSIDVKNTHLHRDFLLPNALYQLKLTNASGIHNSCYTGTVIIVAFLENATIGYSLESLCVCVCVCVCVFAR